MRPPRQLLDQLRPGGAMFIPVGPTGRQMAMLYEKRHDGSIVSRELFGVIYVPLTDLASQYQSRS